MTLGKIFLASESQIWISERAGYRHLVKSSLFLLGKGNIDAYLIPWSGVILHPIDGIVYTFSEGGVFSLVLPIKYFILFSFYFLLTSTSIVLSNVMDHT